VLVPLLPAASAVLFSVAYDATRSFLYAPYYYVGLGPILLGAWASRRARLALIAASVGLGLVNLAFSARVDLRSPHSRLDTPEALAFLLEHTRPGDRIVAGPPFILASARPELPGGRTIPRVVPQPYYLDPFEEPVYRREIRELTDVYIGTPEWYSRPVWTEPAGDGLFPGAEVREFTLEGERIIVARARRPRP